MRKPFTVSTPAAPAAPKPGPVIDRGAAIDKAIADGTTLFEAGAEVMMPDGDVGPVEVAPKAPGERPVYGNANPYPPAVNGKKPYKI